MFAGLYAKLIGVALIAAAVLGAWWYVHHLQTEVKDLTTQVTVLESKLKDQNDAVDALKKDADTRLASAKKDLDVAKAETVKAKGRSVIIYKTKPADPKDLCKSALDLVNTLLAPAAAASGAAQ
jgi:cell division protein FtsL